jgi:hypothetical protein
MVRYNESSVTATPACAAPRRSGKARTSNKRAVPAHPRRDNVRDPRVAPSPQLAVYDGRDRLGSFRRDGDTFEAFDRRGQFLGRFATQAAAAAAIERGAVS